MHPHMPNFLIVGAAKSGTTALHAYLDEHPQVFMSAIKETNFFAWDGENTQTWLGRAAGNEFLVRMQEDYAALFADADGYGAVGEASPLYLESPVAAAKIHEALPEARIVVSLRNPADRAFSAYMMNVRDGNESWKLEDAFTAESHYVQVGFYHDKLKRYYDVFPSDRIHVMLFDELRADTEGALSRLFDFLGVDPEFCPDLGRAHNVGGFPRFKALNSMLARAMRNEGLKGAMPEWILGAGRWLKNRNTGAKIAFPEDLRRRLTETYREDVALVEDLIGRDLSAWTDQDST